MAMVSWSLSHSLFSCGKIFLNALLRETSNLELGMSIAVKLEKPMESDAVADFIDLPMCGVAGELTEDEFLEHIDAMMTQLIVLAIGGSGWVMGTMKQLGIRTASCSNVTGGSYLGTPPIPNSLKRLIPKGAHKRDIFCFL